MEPLVRFSELSGSQNAAATRADTAPPPIPADIELLRRRLVSGEFRDPVEVTVAIVGELVYLTYKDLITRKRLL